MFFPTETDRKLILFESSVQALINEHESELMDSLKERQTIDPRYQCNSAKPIYGTPTAERLYRDRVKRGGPTERALTKILETLASEGASPQAVVNIITTLNGSEFKTLPYFYLLQRNEIDTDAEAVRTDVSADSGKIVSLSPGITSLYLTHKPTTRRASVDLQHDRAHENPVKALTTIAHEIGHHAEDRSTDHSIQIEGHAFTPSTEAVSTCVSLYLCQELVKRGLVSPTTEDLVRAAAHQQSIFNWVTRGKVL